MSTKKPLKQKHAYDAKQAFKDGVMTGAHFYARSMRHFTDGRNPTLLKLSDSVDEISDSFDICKEFSEKRLKDWRIGNFVSPNNTKDFICFPWSKGSLKLFVLDTHPSGKEGIESAGGVLELVAWWATPKGFVRDPITHFVPADQWAVA